MDSWWILVAALYHYGLVGFKMLAILAMGAYLVITAVLFLYYCGPLLMNLFVEKISRVFEGVEFVGGFKIMIILGSGEYTQKILSLTPNLASMSPRIYVAANDDRQSLESAERIEDKMNPLEVWSFRVKFLTTTRIRNVDQGWLTAFFYSGPLAFYKALSLILHERPDSILANGTDLCVPFFVLSFVLKRLRLLESRIVYVESRFSVDERSWTDRYLIRLADDHIIK